MDTYKDLAERYDRMASDNSARRAFFRALFERHGVRRILDCACGTGRDLIMFHQMGYQVEGSDLSEAMLSEARKNFDRAGVSAPLRKLDMRDLASTLESTFDAVVCLSNSINELLDDADVIRALREMKASLTPGGIVVLDQGQNDASMRNPNLYDLVINDSDLTRLLLMEYGNDDMMTVRVLEMIHTDDVQDCTETIVRLRIRLRADWERLFQAAGFSHASFYGDWDNQPYNAQTARRLIAVAMR